MASAWNSKASFKGAKARPDQDNIVDDLEISYYTLMANAYKDFEMEANSNVDIFFGVGLGRLLPTSAAMCLTQDPSGTFRKPVILPWPTKSWSARHGGMRMTSL